MEVVASFNKYEISAIIVILIVIEGASRRSIFIFIN